MPRLSRVVVASIGADDRTVKTDASPSQAAELADGGT